MELDALFVGGYEALDYVAVREALAEARAMAGTPQDPTYHAEGDVWTHTRMVCDAIVADEDWPALEAAERRLMLTAALLHDVAKPEVTFTDPNGRIRSPRHAVRGAFTARRLLWELGEPLEFREEVAALVRHHMQPRYLPARDDPRRRLYAISYATRNDRLAMLARADARGRMPQDAGGSLRQIRSFVELCRRHDCHDRPRRFPSAHSRFLFFRHRLDDPDADVPPPRGPDVVIMAGLPGSGKDTWVGQHCREWPVISLDAIRLELGVSPAAQQEPVVRLAHERAIALLEAGRGFVWNATTLSQRHRRTLLDLLAPYDPSVTMVNADAPLSLLLRRNAGRAAHAVVPEHVIHRMTGIWEPPDLTEAHQVIHVTHDRGSRQRRVS